MFASSLAHLASLLRVANKLLEMVREDCLTLFADGMHKTSDAVGKDLWRPSSGSSEYR